MKNHQNSKVSDSSDNNVDKKHVYIPDKKSNKPVRSHNNNKSSNSWSFSSIKCVLFLVLSIVLPILFACYVSYNINNLKKLEPVKYNDVIAGAPSYKWFHAENFFQQKTIDLFKSILFNGEPLSTVIEDNDFSNVESAGEAVEIGHVDCMHPFMTLNLNRTMCHFSNRLDVGMHFVLTGGFNGYIEYFERMVARILPFRKRLIQKAHYYDSSSIDFKKLEELNTEPFLDKVKEICLDNGLRSSSAKNKNNIINEIFQLDLLLMLPGQELPMHLNVPSFIGANRSTLPHWLLVAMKNSKLFDHLYVHQVQGLAEIDLEDTPTKKQIVKDEYVDINGDGGDFYLYPYLPYDIKSQKKYAHNGENEQHIENENINKYVILKSMHNSAILLDGAQVIHGVDRYKPQELPPLFATNHLYNINFNAKSNKWNLIDSKNNFLSNYNRNDLKLWVVWNMHCFENEAQKSKTANKLTLDEIMTTFKNDLKKKNRLPTDDISALDLWTIVLKEYLSYPTNTHNQNSTIFGFNYCLLPNILPRWFTEKFLKSILLKRC